jgi:serine/threonine protein kinase
VDVALKTVRPELLADQQALDRFRREVQLARQVTHPNVCRIFDVGRDVTGGRDIVFLTMEFLHGETLSQILRSTGRRDPIAAVRSSAIRGKPPYLSAWTAGRAPASSQAADLTDLSADGH